MPQFEWALSPNFDTATLYGGGNHELLVGKALKDLSRWILPLLASAAWQWVDGKRELNVARKHRKTVAEDSLKTPANRPNIDY